MKIHDLIRNFLVKAFAFGIISFSCFGEGDNNEETNQARAQLQMLQQRFLNAYPQQPNTPATVQTTPLPPGTAAATPDLVPPSLSAPVPPPGVTAAPGAQTTTVVEHNVTVVEKKPEISEDQEVDALAFKETTRQLFPLSPARIKRLRHLYQNEEFARTAPAGTPPKPTATSQFVNLSPGATPPVIRLSQGFVSSLVFLDSTGAPWPISAYDLGDPSSFNIQWDKTSNTLMIQAVKLYNYGNLAVRLKGLNTPVMLTLIPGQKAVDYRVDLRVQGHGPNAAALAMEVGLPPSANNVLLHVLEGVPPEGSQRLLVTGGDARAWLFREKIYVRTNLTILSPGWISSMTSADGMHAYELQKTPVVLVSWHGKVMQLKIEGL